MPLLKVLALAVEAATGPSSLSILQALLFVSKVLKGKINRIHMKDNALFRMLTNQLQDCFGIPSLPPQVSVSVALISSATSG